MLWIFELSKTQLGGGGILQKTRDERRGGDKGKEKKIIHYYFLPPLILGFALVSLFVRNVPFASLGLQNVPVREGYMHRNSKEKRLDCSKNYGEGISKLRTNYKKVSNCHFYAPEGGFLQKLLSFFFPFPPLHN